jgi:hypothetical protein
MNDMTEIRSWLAGRLPQGWFVEAPEVMADRDEILVVGRIEDVAPSEGVDVGTARSGRIKKYREDTREERIRIAAEAQRKFGRHVSWAVRIGESSELFTHLAVPVMTRLRIRERSVLDRLVRSGVVQNRSQAMAWCVRLVAEKESDWLADLAEAMQQVELAREKGPRLN